MMNRDKVVSLSNRLNEIVEEAKRHPNGNPGYITWDKAVYAIEALSKEANSKPVMPKVFDDWYKDQYDRNFNILNKIIENYARIFWADFDGNDELSKNLMFWSARGNSSEDWLRKLIKGIDAIRYGYEVEK